MWASNDANSSICVQRTDQRTYGCNAVFGTSSVFIDDDCLLVLCERLEETLLRGSVHARVDGIVELEVERHVSTYREQSRKFNVQA